MSVGVILPLGATAVIDKAAGWTADLNQPGVVFNSTSGSAQNVTLPANAPVGFNLLVVQLGAGQVTFVPASGAFIRHPLAATKIAAQYGIASLTVVRNTGGAAAEYLLSGYVL